MLRRSVVQINSIYDSAELYGDSATFQTHHGRGHQGWVSNILYVL